MNCLALHIVADVDVLKMSNNSDPVLVALQWLLSIGETWLMKVEREVIV